MSNEADEHGLPHGARDVIVSYALHRLWMTKDQDKAVEFKNLYKDDLKEYIEFVGQARQVMNANYQRVVFGDDLYDPY